MSVLRKSILLSLLYLTLSATPSSAVDRWVAVGGVDSGDCSNSGSPCGSIQYAINSSTDGDVVNVNDGTYFENINFSGLDIAVRSISGPESTTIDGGGNATVVAFQNDEQVTSVLDGFTVTNGTSELGGGIYISFSSPTITNCIITGNLATSTGGGIYTIYSSPTITNCIISGNTASYGGGICTNGSPSSPTITNCTISGNSASSWGGGFFIPMSSTSIIDSTISGNSAYHGGGIQTLESPPTITNCTISGNLASSWGGGINITSNSEVTLTNCNIISNRADNYGGGISNKNSSSTITKCIIRGNTAFGGGGIISEHSSTIITNCIISGNSASYGGGIRSGGSSPTFINSTTITNSTISRNYAGSGGGIYDVDSLTSIINSILWEDHPDEVISNGSWASITITYSNIQGGWPGVGNINVDPVFVNERSAVEAPTTAGDYHLRVSSPCIDQATDDVATYPTIPPYDIDGDLRPQGTEFDMGADEYYGLWNASINLGDGWRWLNWFGYFYDVSSPWIYHLQHGWMHPFGTSTDSIVFWDYAMNAFWWTSDTQYPYVYRFSDGEWLWYLEGSSGPRWFIRLSDGVWESW